MMSQLQQLASDQSVNASPTAPPASDDHGAENLGLADESFDPSTNPIVDRISSADLPGVTYTPADLQRPELAQVAKNAKTLASKLGLAIYQNPKTKVGALFNPLVYKMAEVKAADAKGKLGDLLPSVAKILGDASAAPAGADAVAPPPASAAQPGGQPISKGSQTALTQGRIQALVAEKKDPTYPGGGKILNSLAR